MPVILWPSLRVVTPAKALPSRIVTPGTPPSRTSRTASGTEQIIFGFLAVLLATLNIVGGFTVTDRMLEMFKAKPGDNAPKRNSKAADAEGGAK